MPCSSYSSVHAQGPDLTDHSHPPRNLTQGPESRSQVLTFCILNLAFPGRYFLSRCFAILPQPSKQDVSTAHLLNAAHSHSPYENHS
jgi:hypothetical protein